MKNTLVDLNNHLFEQLERLNDESLNEDELKKEVKRAKAMASVACQIINNGSLILRSIVTENELFGKEKELPSMLSEK